MNQLHQPEANQLHQPEANQLHQPEANQLHQPEANQLHQPEANQLHQPEANQLHQPRERVSLIERGRARINERWPGYGDLLTDEALLRRAGKDWPHVGGYPLPSQLFAGLDPACDDRLKREQRDKDVTLCRALAAVPKGHQREFFELYLVDPKDAAHWASLPSWQRLIRKGDPDDVLIWKFFIIQRLNMEQAARDTAPWSMESQGAQLPQMFGLVRSLTPAGVRKLCFVMSAYGTTLQDRRDVGDVVHPPWTRGRT